MKKISLLSIGLLCGLLLFAQHRTMSYSHHTTSPHATFGLKAGVNIANINDDGTNTVDSRIGLHIGGLAHIHFAPNLAVQPEIVYSQQGAKYSDGTTKVDYINIPVLLQYMFDQGLRLETGPQVGFLTSAKFERNNGTEVNIKSSIKSSDVSWAFGLGLVTHSGLGFDARYNLGLTDINQSSPYEAKNRVWQLGLFYQFPQ